MAPWAYLVMFAVGFLYQVPPDALWGKSLGKLIVGITIVSARDLGRPGWWRAIRRWGIYVVAGLIPFIGGLLNLGLLLAGLVLLWAHEKRQTVHDMVADTLVVRNYAVPWRKW